MYNKAKRYRIPAYKEAKGMRGELIRKVVNYLHRLNDDTTIPTFRHNAHFAILTAHDENVLAHTGDVEVAGFGKSLENGDVVAVYLVFAGVAYIAEDGDFGGEEVDGDDGVLEQVFSLDFALDFGCNL